MICNNIFIYLRENKLWRLSVKATLFWGDKSGIFRPTGKLAEILSKLWVDKQQIQESTISKE
jgi:hypothetical protein